MANRVEFNGMNLLDGSFAPEFATSVGTPGFGALASGDAIPSTHPSYVSGGNNTVGEGGLAATPTIIAYDPTFGSNGLHFQVGANENQLMWTSIRNMSVLAETHGTRASGTDAGSATSALTTGGSLGHAMQSFINNWETAFALTGDDVTTTGGVATIDITEWGVGGGALANVPPATDQSAATQAQALSALIESVEAGIQFTSLARAELGAISNRLEYTMRSLDISSENLSDAESRVRNADMAREMMAFTMANVLQQASVSMLAQANQLPNNLLQLLR
jgi:flagellin